MNLAGLFRFRRTRTLIFVCLALLFMTIALRLAFAPSSDVGHLVDGSSVVLESVTRGTNHVAPTRRPPAMLGLLPAKWLQVIKWKSGSPLTLNQKTSTTVFWLTFNNSKGDASVRYAIADENGFEAPVPFSGAYRDFNPGGFGTNFIGHARSFGLTPRRCGKFYLRLYQQSAKGDLVRVANFPIQNASVTNVSNWSPASLPITRATNDLAFQLIKAEVGVAINEKLRVPYDSFPGQWSEFTFRVNERGEPSPGWSINEIWIEDATGNRIRTSKEDLWSLNGTFSRNQDGQIICTHRWSFWPGEPAWKLRVRFEHETKPDFWAEYFVLPAFLNRP